MTVKELLNIKFSLYGRAHYSAPTSSTTLLYWLGKMSEKCKEDVLKIRRNEWILYKEGKLGKKEYQKAKASRLPACSPSAVFGNVRQIGYELEKTGIMILDIDNVNVDEIDIAKKNIMKLPYVFFASDSVSGEGFFCGVYYNKDNDFVETFNALALDFKEIGYYIDPNCKDITRLRYVSYSDKIYIKPVDSEIEMYNKVYKRDNYNDKHEYTEIKNLTKDDYYLLVYTIYYLVDKLGYGKKKLPYSDISNEYDYDAWMNDGYRLSNIARDDIGLKLFQYISEHADGYEGAADVEENFYKFQGYSDGYINIGYYFWLAKELLGDDWKDIVRYKK